MNDGVKLLLERIKTNPEEFTEGKWYALIQSHKMYLNPEDCKALDDGINTLMQQRFTEEVMKELLAPEEDNSLGKPWYSKQGNITLSAGQTLGHASLTLTTDPLVQAHIDAHNAVLKKQKKHKTLFGKLFNYS